MAPRGRQTVHQFFNSSLKMVDEQRMREALTGWRRVEGCTGENLDHRGQYGAGDMPDGKPANYGVPGAIWLATQALAFTRIMPDVDGGALTTLWHRRSQLLGNPNASGAIMVWPLWQPALDPIAVDTLLHTGLPGARLVPPQKPKTGRVPPQDLRSTVEVPRRNPTPEVWNERLGTYQGDLEALGVMAIGAATRRPTKHHAGPLTPIWARFV